MKAKILSKLCTRHAFFLTKPGVYKMSRLVDK